MELYLVILSGFVTVFSLGLLAISLYSYRKSKNMKLLAVSCVFLIFLIKGILLSIGVFFPNSGMPSASLWFILFDVVILLLLFIATLKR
ncbi:MAG: hypothetical protein V1726_01385 [Methanobacteriota archaeon]